MKRAIVLAVLACVQSPPADAAGELPSAPAPSPMVPPAVEVGPPVVSIPALPDPDLPAVTKGARKARKKPPTIRLGEKRETDNPEWRGAGYMVPGKFKVKAEKGKLTAVLTGAAFSHCFLGVHSMSVGSLRLVQEFEIVPGSPEDPLVQVSLSGKLDGYVRSDKQGAAGLRVASASISPACGGPAVWLAFPPCRVSEVSRERCASEVEPVRSVLAAGRYVLEANLVFETTAEGCLRGHAEAVFAPGNHFLGTWDSPDSPKPEVERDDFGLAVTLKVAAPPSDPGAQK